MTAMLEFIKYVFNYFIVCLSAVGVILFDARPGARTNIIDWMILFLVALAVVSVGEWLSGGLLLSGVTALRRFGRYSFKENWWHAFYYAVMCLLYAVCVASVYGWIRRD